MIPMTQAELVATLMAQGSAPAQRPENDPARAAIHAVAGAAETDLSGSRDPADLDQVMQVVVAAMRGIPESVRNGSVRRATIDIGHAATFLAHGIAHDKTIDEVLAAFDLASEAADQLTALAPATSREEPGHVLPISTAIGVSFLIGTDETVLSDAIGIASSMTVATRAPDRTGPADSRLVAMCCANGTLAAHLANEGFTASPRGIEGKRGWRASLGGADAESAPVPTDAGFDPASTGTALPSTSETRLRKLFPSLAGSIEQGATA